MQNVFDVVGVNKSGLLCVLQQQIFLRLDSSDFNSGQLPQQLQIVLQVLQSLLVEVIPHVTSIGFLLGSHLVIVGGKPLLKLHLQLVFSHLFERLKIRISCLQNSHWSHSGNRICNSSSSLCFHAFSLKFQLVRQTNLIRRSRCLVCNGKLLSNCSSVIGVNISKIGSVSAFRAGCHGKLVGIFRNRQAFSSCSKLFFDGSSHFERKKIYF